MSDLIKFLRDVAGDSMGMEPGDRQLIAEAADEIERLQSVVDAAKEMASDYEAYDVSASMRWINYLLHDPEILAAVREAIAALEVDDD